MCIRDRFLPNEIPDEYSLGVVIEEFVFTIGPDGGGGIGINPGDVDYVNAPYEISVNMNNQTGDPFNDGVDSLDIVIGYLKYNWSRGWCRCICWSWFWNWCWGTSRFRGRSCSWNSCS